jgi:5-methylcytosine-specific restriction endonuclease McrA
MEKELSDIDLELKMELQKIKDKYNSIKKTIRLKYKHKEQESNKITKPKIVRKSIPKTLKNKVWDKYIGKQLGVGLCDVCQTEIDSKNFECGHIISIKEEGSTTLDNLIPICGTCNKSMGTHNLELFKETYFTKNESTKERIITNFVLEKIEYDNLEESKQVKTKLYPNSMFSVETMSNIKERPFLSNDEIYEELKTWGVHKYSFLGESNTIQILINVLQKKFGEMVQKKNKCVNTKWINKQLNNSHGLYRQRDNSSFETISNTNFGDIWGNNSNKQTINQWDITYIDGFYDIKYK